MAAVVDPELEVGALVKRRTSGVVRTGEAELDFEVFVLAPELEQLVRDRVTSRFQGGDQSLAAVLGFELIEGRADQVEKSEEGSIALVELAFSLTALDFGHRDAAVQD